MRLLNSSNLWICPAGIPKTQSPSSTISSLKRPQVSTSLPAAPTTPGTSTMRKTRISSGARPRLLACTPHPHRTRFIVYPLLVYTLINITDKTCCIHHCRRSLQHMIIHKNSKRSGRKLHDSAKIKPGLALTLVYRYK